MKQNSAAGHKQAVASNDSLRTWNFVFAALLALGGAALLVLSAPRDYPLSLSYLTTDTLQTKLQGVSVAAPAVHQLVMVNLTYLVGGALFAGALVHLLAATRLRKQYETTATQGLPPLRLAQYVVEGILLTLAVALPAGVYDVSTLLSFVMFVVVAGVGVWIVKRPKAAGSQAARSGVVTMALMAGIMPFILLALALIASWVFGEGTPPRVVPLVYATGVVSVAFLTLHGSMSARRRGRWADTVFVERVYMVLNGAALLLISLELYVAVLRP